MTTSAVLSTIATRIAKKLFHFPPNDKTIQRLLGIVARAEYESIGAAMVSGTNALVPKIATHPGQVTRLYAVLGHTAWGPGEHIVLDVQKNGVTILNATIQLGDTTMASQGVYDITGSVVTGTQINPGDELTAVFVYTAGSGATTPDLGIYLEWGSI